MNIFRLKVKRKEIDYILREGKLVKDDNFVIRYLDSGNWIKIILKKGFKNSVLRNKTKRRIREIVWKSDAKSGIGKKVLIIVKPSAQNLSFETLKNELLELLKDVK